MDEHDIETRVQHLETKAHNHTQMHEDSLAILKQLVERVKVLEARCRTAEARIEALTGRIVH